MQVTVSVTDVDALGRPKVGQATVDVTMRTPCLFGASVTPYPDSGRTYEQEIAAHETDVAPMHILRSYDGGLPDTWFTKSTDPGSRVPAVPGWENRASWHSVKPDLEALAAGELDGWLSEYIHSIPVTGRPRYLTFWHEPETKVKAGTFDWQRWVDGNARARQVITREQHPDVRLAAAFTSKFTIGGAKPYYLDGMLAVAPAGFLAGFDMIGWDPYNEASKNGDYGAPWDDPAYYVDDCLAWTLQHAPGVPMGIGETGFVPNPGDAAARPAWLARLADYAEDNRLAAVCYFDASVGSPWWLRRTAASADLDTASAEAWRAVYAR